MRLGIQGDGGGNKSNSVAFATGHRPFVPDATLSIVAARLAWLSHTGRWKTGSSISKAACKVSQTFFSFVVSLASWGQEESRNEDGIWPVSHGSHDIMSLGIKLSTTESVGPEEVRNIGPRWQFQLKL